MSDQLPVAAVVLSYTVADFDVWKAVFDANEQGRADNGVLGHHINRGQDDPNSLGVYLAVGDLDKLKAYMASPELKGLMAEAGVTSVPEYTWMTPVRESIVWDRNLPALMVGHRVADFDAWLAGYDAADDMRGAAGIIGHAANRMMDDPSTVLVYHQAESFDALRAMTESDELKSAMAEAGVISEPQITFHTGGWAKLYS